MICRDYGGERGRGGASALLTPLASGLLDVLALSWQRMFFYTTQAYLGAAERLRLKGLAQLRVENLLRDDEPAVPRVRMLLSRRHRVALVPKSRYRLREK